MHWCSHWNIASNNSREISGYTFFYGTICFLCVLQQNRQLIKDSFLVCGVSNALDGSEDDQIHCFKPDGPCSAGRELLAAEMAALLNSQEVTVVHNEEDEDRNQNRENGCESDASDASIELWSGPSCTHLP